MLNKCKTDKNIKAIVCYELSRLSRDQYDSAYIRTELRKKDISIVSATEHITDDAMGDAMAGILSVVNQLSSAQTAQRVSDNMMNKAMRGDWPGKAAFGYINKQEKVATGRVKAWVEVSPEDAPWVVKAFEYYATGSYSIDELVVKLREEGFPEDKLRGGKISKSFLSKVLRNGFYNGNITWAAYQGKGNHDIFLDKTLFMQVQQMLDIQNKGADRTRKYESFTKSICFCGECGSRMTLDKHKTTSGNEITYLRCIKAKQGKRVICSQGYGHLDDYIQEISKVLKGVQIPEKIVLKVKSRIKELFADEDKLNKATHDEIQKQLDKFKTKKRNLVHMLLDKENPTDNDRALYEETRREIDVEEIRLVGELEKSQTRMSDMMRLVDLALALATNAHTAFAKTKDDQLRGLLARTLFKKIEIKDKKITQYELNSPLDYLSATQFRKSSSLVPFEQGVVCGP
jgi:DNA invertase Pin-like site-specific DNA recombinase